MAVDYNKRAWNERGAGFRIAFALIVYPIAAVFALVAIAGDKIFGRGK